MARYLWDTEAYARIANEINPIYQKALEALSSDTFEKLKLGAE